MPMYVLGDNRQPEKLPSEPALIYQAILEAFEHAAKKNRNQVEFDYIQRSHNTFIAEKQNCLKEIEQRCYKGSTTLRTFFLAQRHQYCLKKDLLQWGLHIVGIIREKPKFKFEVSLAKKIQKNKAIHQSLVEACQLVNQYCKVNYPQILTSVYDGYDHYNYFIAPYTVAQVMADPHKFDINHCISALHCLSKNIYSLSVGTLTVPHNLQLATDANANRISFNRDGFIRSYPCSKWQYINGEMFEINELSPAIIGPRLHDMPTCLPSFTTGRMLKLIEEAGGNKSHKKALAYGVFSFWKVRYWQNISSIHHYHSIMDMAVNFGVSYETFTYNDIIAELDIEDEAATLFESAQQNSDSQFVAAIKMYAEVLKFIALLPIYLINIALHLELHIKETLFNCMMMMVALIYRPNIEFNLGTLNL